MAEPEETEANVERYKSRESDGVSVTASLSIQAFALVMLALFLLVLLLTR